MGEVYGPPGPQAVVVAVAVRRDHLDVAGSREQLPDPVDGDAAGMGERQPPPRVIHWVSGPAIEHDGLDLPGFRRHQCRLQDADHGREHVVWTDDPDEEASATEYRRVLLRYYTVFNLEQCEEIEVPEAQPSEGGPEFDPIPACEAVYGNMPDPPQLRHGGERAFYRRSADLVQLPRREAFSRPEHYYSTQFHELAHSTGHPSRLNRFAEEDNPGIFGSPAYAREELVAEMTAAMMCGALGISPVKVEAISPDGGEELLESSAAYLRHWMDVLSRAVVIAAARAQKAADYILGRQGQAEIPEHAEAA